MENQAAGSSCPCLALPPRQGGDPPAAGWGEGADINQEHPGQETHPRFLPHHQPLSFPHSCGCQRWLALRRSTQPGLGANWVYLALKIHASHGKASTTVPMEKIQLVTTSLTKKPKTCLLLSNIYLQKLWQLLFQFG